MRLKFAMSQIRIRHVAEYLLIRGLFLVFPFSLERAAFWSYSRKCLQSKLSLLCNKNNHNETGEEFLFYPKSQIKNAHLVTFLVYFNLIIFMPA